MPTANRRYYVEVGGWEVHLQYLGKHPAKALVYKWGLCSRSKNTIEPGRDKGVKSTNRQWCTAHKKQVKLERKQAA